MPLKTRFAPSPTGHLHLGHAFSALTAYQYAKDNAGDFLLRVEDIDTTRCRPHFEEALIEDLKWLGLKWPQPVRRQSDHFDDYATALLTLRDKGLVYRCFKTRKEIAAETARAPHPNTTNTPAVYNGPTQPLSQDEEQTRIESGASYAWRLSLSYSQDSLGEKFNQLAFHEEGEGPNQERGEIRFRPELCGDFIIARKEIPTSYHLSVVVDDAHQDISHIVRGNDLFEATHCQVLLQALLGLPTPVYVHHRLITDKTGKRLAKRDHSTTLATLRETGTTALELRKQLGLAQ